MSKQADTPIEWSNKHLRLAVEAASVAMWSWNVENNSFRMDPRGFELWGLEWAESVEDILWRRTKLGLRLTADQIAALDVYMIAAAQDGALSPTAE